MCSSFLVISKWSKLVKASWPAAALECPRCLEPIVLDGSRMADNLVKAGKVSSIWCINTPPSHALVCNNTIMKAAATALSDMPQLGF